MSGFYGIRMHLNDLTYAYPEALIATEKSEPSRVMWVSHGGPREITVRQLLELFQPGDVLVLNDSRVLKRRIFSADGLEILFLKRLDEPSIWQVLFPASRMKTTDTLILPGNLTLTLHHRGLPQEVRL